MHVSIRSSVCASMIIFSVINFFNVSQEGMCKLNTKNTVSHASYTVGTTWTGVFVICTMLRGRNVFKYTNHSYCHETECNLSLLEFCIHVLGISLSAHTQSCLFLPVEQIAWLSVSWFSSGSLAMKP